MTTYGILASAEKVYLKLARWCYWDNMYADIRNHCINCANCQKGKSGLKIKHPPLINLAHVTEPITDYIIDFLKLSLTSKSNLYLLTVVDRACNMTHLFSLSWPISWNDGTLFVYIYHRELWSYVCFTIRPSRSIPRECYENFNSNLRYTSRSRKQ